MGLRFLLGRAGTGKSGRALDEIKQKSIQEPQGPTIIYLVPDQMTFQQEYGLFHSEELQGSIRTQVMSFSRLAWVILQEVGGATRPFISSMGTQMMLRKIINEKQSEWSIFQKAIEKQGFLEEIESLISEFKRYNINPEDLKRQIDTLDRFVHKEAHEVTLMHKLNDLVFIYDQLVQQLQGKYVDAEDRLQLLAKQIKDSTFLQDAEIYIDGFYRFTPQELLVIEAMLKKCKQVTVLLTLDEPDKPDLSELDLFYQTSETYHTLKDMAHTLNIPIDDVIVLEPKHGKFKENPAFLHLEAHFNQRPTPVFTGDVPIQIAEAVHPRAEVEGVAQEIIRLVRDENFRFKDMAIFIREPDVYHDLITTVFEDYQIPVFIDEKRTMLNHPLIEFLRSLLDVVEGDWRYDAVFRLLKTGFIPASDSEYPLTDDAIDELENYVLEYGIRTRKKWLDDQDWIFQRFQGFEQAVQTDSDLEKQEKINRYRQQIKQALGNFDHRIREAHTVRDCCEILYQLLETLKVPEQLEEQRQQFEERGENQKAREQEQVWDAIIQLFDELVEIAGEEEMTLVSFRAVLESGFESLKFAHVPPSLDHVIVGTIDRSRMSNIKCAFLLGVNEGVWPMKPPADGVINEQERDLLAEHGLKLAASSKRTLLDDWFYMYTAFTTAEDRLWVSYVLSDEEGETKIPSQIIKQLMDMFPTIPDVLLLQDPDELLEADRFITNPMKTRAALTTQLARYHKGYPMKPIWKYVLNWFIDHHKKYSTTYQVLQSIYYKNEPTPLSKSTVEELYPKKVQTSVSRLEMFYRCSYQHFAQYSLGLKERKTFTLDAPDIGSLFHEALKLIMQWVTKEGKDLRELSKQDTNVYAERAIVHLSPILLNHILSSSNRYKYLQRKLQDVVARATFILSEQARKSGFTPVSVEVGFGDKQTLKPLVISLPNGYELILRGRIDRVDQAIYDQKLYLRIVDYKSSETKLNLLDVYYGLALQMLTYLDVILSQSEEWLGMKAQPAGVLYFHVHNAMISNNQDLADDRLEKELFRQYKMQGMLISDEQIVKLMDTSLESGTSDIIPVGIKKDGNFYSYSQVASDQIFTNLRSYIRQLMIQAGIQMTSGDIELNPFERGNRTACTFCMFKSLCQFDPSLDENNFRRLMDMKEEEVLTKIAKKEGH